jgi:hypothetical protein
MNGTPARSAIAASPQNKGAGNSMIPKSDARFSDKIMLTKTGLY